MNNETEMVLILWEKIKDFIPANKRDDAALQMLIAINSFLDEVNLQALLGEDEILDDAINSINEDEVDAIEDMEDEEDGDWE